MCLAHRSFGVELVALWMVRSKNESFTGASLELCRGHSRNKAERQEGRRRRTVVEERHVEEIERFCYPL